MDNIFGNWYSGNLDLWKLDTAQDYINFFAVMIAGIVVFTLWTKYLKAHRTYEHACARTAKKLKKLGGHGAESYCNVTVHTKKDSCPCELIHVCGSTVYVVKIFWWGRNLGGSATGKEWTFSCRKEVYQEPNPLPALNEACVVLNRLFARFGVRGVTVKPLVVLADNYNHTYFEVSGTDCVVNYDDLKKWRKANPVVSDKNVDIKAVKAALEASFAGREPVEEA